ncbi:transposase [Pedobacter mucosus]|uniref:transposase n=1 Tax=Pedobacter mucosus TaxID=2895286 RepID=UPI001EE471B7|nr:transposase [Pedobacter mucosus]UKT63593.1 transposase [Pedobacter mucosus]
MKIEENSYCHIYNRGNNKGLIFFHEENYFYFLERFKKYVCPHVEIFAYCLMANHFHFFIKVNNVTGFENGIKNFFISYTKSINQSYARVGSLFQGRYKWKKVDSESYFTRLVTYIHQNPKSLSFANKQLQDYKYSSYKDYLNKEATFINTKVVFEWFGSLDEFIAAHNTYD